MTDEKILDQKIATSHVGIHRLNIELGVQKRNPYSEIEVYCLKGRIIEMRRGLERSRTFATYPTSPELAVILDSCDTNGNLVFDNGAQCRIKSVDYRGSSQKETELDGYILHWKEFAELGRPKHAMVTIHHKYTAIKPHSNVY